MMNYDIDEQRSVPLLKYETDNVHVSNDVDDNNDDGVSRITYSTTNSISSSVFEVEDGPGIVDRDDDEDDDVIRMKSSSKKVCVTPVFLDMLYDGTYSKWVCVMVVYLLFGKVFLGFIDFCGDDEAYAVLFVPFVLMGVSWYSSWYWIPTGFACSVLWLAGEWIEFLVCLDEISNTSVASGMLPTVGIAVNLVMVSCVCVLMFRLCYKTWRSSSRERYVWLKTDIEIEDIPLRLMLAMFVTSFSVIFSTVGVIAVCVRYLQMTRSGLSTAEELLAQLDLTEDPTAVKALIVAYRVAEAALISVPVGIGAGAVLSFGWHYITWRAYTKWVLQTFKAECAPNCHWTDRFQAIPLSLHDVSKVKYSNAVFFVPTYLGCHIVGVIAVTTTVALVLFTCICQYTRQYVGYYVASNIGVWIVNVLVRAVFIGRVLTRPTHIEHPRVFALVDCVYGLSLGLVYGMFAAILRIALAIGWVVVHVFRVHAPLTDSLILRSFDMGFTSFAAMLRIRFEKRPLHHHSNK